MNVFKTDSTIRMQAEIQKCLGFNKRLQGAGLTFVALYL